MSADGGSVGRPQATTLTVSADRATTSTEDGLTTSIADRGSFLCVCRHYIKVGGHLHGWIPMAASASSDTLPMEFTGIFTRVNTNSLVYFSSTIFPWILECEMIPHGSCGVWMRAGCFGWFGRAV